MAASEAKKRASRCDRGARFAAATGLDQPAALTRIDGALARDGEHVDSAIISGSGSLVAVSALTLVASAAACALQDREEISRS